ncbi:uncharacterized protein BDZ99DRAFT_458331 [Mytilinidion resinicola]|uniref:N-acetyltransferase domain-containing protein n=1 Tax=Mytilinidion resinicola TaxID=574789 RepID=A0A6A6Z717_9PEZI|nr:uncharacterized protein BDZ99DRAFT_458331 [Mytilinidion resinicola]KAF2816463.1 hypothetical protein BDZ99DRAFT_458331 [Mytilinidion resinicola]
MSSTTPPPPKSFTTQILTKSDLLSQPTLNNATISLINAAFSTHKSRDPDAWDNTISRFPPSARPVDPGLANVLGADGLCAIVCDAETGAVVASASVTRWPGFSAVKTDGAAEDAADGSAWLDWEVKCVASLDQAEYRGQGVASRACAAVEEALRARMVGGGEGLRMWIMCNEERIGAYWRRRGYGDVLQMVPPVGAWGSRREFVVAILVKEKGGHVEVDKGRLREWLEGLFEVKGK